MVSLLTDPKTKPVLPLSDTALDVVASDEGLAVPVAKADEAPNVRPTGAPGSVVGGPN